MPFWITFAISEALTVVGLFINNSSLTPAQKAALENFITSGQGLLVLF